jgi:hypothetical protein
MREVSADITHTDLLKSSTKTAANDNASLCIPAELSDDSNYLI